MRGFGHVGLWVGAEDLRGGAGSGRDGADAVAGEGVDGVDVVYVDDAGGAETTEELSEKVHWETSPWKAAVEAVGKGYGWVEVGTGAVESEWTC